MATPSGSSRRPSSPRRSASSAGCSTPGGSSLRRMSDDVRALLTETRTWAVVGCSPDPHRDSHRIASLLQREGYRVIPVNPNVHGELLGERCYRSVTEIPDSE